jgi:hypothetical protein
MLGCKSGGSSASASRAAIVGPLTACNAVEPSDVDTYECHAIIRICRS